MKLKLEADFAKGLSFDPTTKRFVTDQTPEPQPSVTAQAPVPTVYSALSVRLM